MKQVFVFRIIDHSFEIRLHLDLLSRKALSWRYRFLNITGSEIFM